MPQQCIECGAQQPNEALRCSQCGASLVPSDKVELTGGEIFAFSAYTIFIVLIAILIPCLVGLVCILLGR